MEMNLRAFSGSQRTGRVLSVMRRPTGPVNHGAYNQQSTVIATRDGGGADHRFAARLSGLASGLVLAVRPAGSALGLQGQRRAAGASRAAGCKAPLRPEGPTRTMGGVPPCRRDIFPATGTFGARVTAWPWCWRARQRDAAGTAGGGHRGAMRGSRRAVGLASEPRGWVSYIGRMSHFRHRRRSAWMNCLARVSLPRPVQGLAFE